MGLCVMHELAQASTDTQQHQLRFAPAFRTNDCSPYIMRPNTLVARAAQSRLYPCLCFVFEEVDIELLSSPENVRLKKGTL